MSFHLSASCGGYTVWYCSSSGFYYLYDASHSPLDGTSASVAVGSYELLVSVLRSCGSERFLWSGEEGCRC